jgi:hypothetical protein
MTRYKRLEDKVFVVPKDDAKYILVSHIVSMLERQPDATHVTIGLRKAMHSDER